jgi:hypothetical protein
MQPMMAVRVVTAAIAAGAIALGGAGPASALPPGHEVTTGDEGGRADPSVDNPPDSPPATPAPPPPGRGGGVHDGPTPPDVGGSNAPPEPNPGAPTPTLRRVAAALHLQNRSVSTLVSVPAGIAIDGGRPFEISVSFGGTRVTQNYDLVHGNRLTHDFSAGDGSRRLEQVDITLRETLANGQFQPYGIRSSLPVEPLYDIKVSDLYFHEAGGHCDVGSPADPFIAWKDPAGANHHEEIDPGIFDDFDVLYSFADTWREVGASRGFTEPGIIWFEEDTGEFHNNYPEVSAGPPLLPGTSRKVQQLIPPKQGGPCLGEFTYFLDYTLHTYQL